MGSIATIRLPLPGFNLDNIPAKDTPKFPLRPEKAENIPLALQFPIRYAPNEPAEPIKSVTVFPPGLTLPGVPENSPARELAVKLAAEKQAAAITLLAESKESIPVKLAALQVLAEQGNANFPTLLFEFYKGNSPALSEDPLLKVAAWQAPDAYLKSCSVLSDKGAASGALLIALTKSKDESVKKFAADNKPLPGNEKREPEKTIYQCVAIAHALERFTEDPVSFYKQVATILQPGLAAVARDLVAAKPGIIDTFFVQGEAAKLSPEAKLALLGAISRQDPTGIEKNLGKVLLIPGGRALVDEFTETYLQKTIHIDFETKVKTVFPHLSHAGVQKVANALIAHSAESACLVLDSPHLFSQHPDAFITAAAREPEEFNKRFEKLKPVLEKISSELPAICREYRDAATALQKFAKCPPEELAKSTLSDFTNTLSPTGRSLFVLSLATSSESGAAFLAKYVKTVAAIDGGMRALLLAGQKFPEAILGDRKAVAAVIDGSHIVDAAEASLLCLSCVDKEGRLDFKKASALNLKEVSDGTRDRVAIWFSQNGGHSLLCEKVGLFAKTRVGEKLLAEAVMLDPEAILRKVDEIKNLPYGKDLLLVATLFFPISDPQDPRAQQPTLENDPSPLLKGLTRDCAGALALYDRLEKAKLTPENYTKAQLEAACVMMGTRTLENPEQARKILSKLSQKQLEHLAVTFTEPGDFVEIPAMVALMSLLDKGDVGQVFRQSVARFNPAAVIRYRELFARDPSLLALAGFHLKIGELLGSEQNKAHPSWTSLGLPTGAAVHADSSLVAVQNGYRQASKDVEAVGSLADGLKSPVRHRFLAGIEGVGMVKADWLPQDQLVALAQAYGPVTFSTAIQLFTQFEARVRDVTSIAVRNLNDRGIRPDKQTFAAEFKDVLEKQKQLERVPLFEGRTVAIYAQAELQLESAFKNIANTAPGTLPLPNSPFWASYNTRLAGPTLFTKPTLVKALEEHGAKSVKVISENSLLPSQADVKKTMLKSMAELPEGGVAIFSGHGFTGRWYIDGGSLRQGVPMTDLLTTAIWAEEFAKVMIDHALDRKTRGLPVVVPLAERRIYIFDKCLGADTRDKIFQEFCKEADKHGISREAFPIIITAAAEGQYSYSAVADPLGSSFFRVAVTQPRGVKASLFTYVIPPHFESNASIFFVDDNKKKNGFGR